MDQSQLIVHENMYIHVQNKNTGKVRTVVGPTRFVRSPADVLLTCDPQPFHFLTKHQYAVILNPMCDTTGENRMGDRAVRTGPAAFPLHHLEMLETGAVQDVHVLGEDEALIVRNRTCSAGSDGLYRVGPGPLRWVPSEEEEIVDTVDARVLTEHEGLYVQNSLTGEVRLERGPQRFILDANEELVEKAFSPPVCSALGLSRNHSSALAHVVHLREREVMCIIDEQTQKETFLVGPKSHTFGFNETPKVFDLSAGKPKKLNQLVISSISLGPDFFSDIIAIRTKDNASLRVHVAFNWMFAVNESEISKVCRLNDFIGVAAQNLTSRIRDVASRYTFEDFSVNTVNLLKRTIFKLHTVPIYGREGLHEMNGTINRENGFLVYDIDVKALEPSNPHIQQELNMSIKSNIRILCKKSREAAEIAMERDKVAQQTELQQLEATLTELKGKNREIEVLGAARTDRDVRKVQATTKAKCFKLVKDAERTAEMNRAAGVAQTLMEAEDMSRHVIELDRLAKMGDVAVDVTATEYKMEHFMLG